tara:strand:- start:52098 stop:52682 length:585 start_codon:yes stop_codon:yes gene_type:complete
MDDYSLNLSNNLRKLTDKNQLQFAFWITKRLFHNYVFFSKKTTFGNIDVMLDALNLIEAYMLKGIRNEIEIREVIEKVEENTPDTNDFSTITVSFALDSCNAINECLRFILDKDIKHIINTGVFFRDTIDMFIQEKEDLDYSALDFENKIQSHEIMIREMGAKKAFLSKLKKNPNESLLKVMVYDKVINPELVW